MSRNGKLPSFGKELFLGHLRLDLIYPQPPIDTEARRRGEVFLDKSGTSWPVKSIRAR